MLIRGRLRDPEWLAGERWADDAYLKAKAGEAVVRVEAREDAHARYGRWVRRYGSGGTCIEWVNE